MSDNRIGASLLERLARPTGVLDAGEVRAAMLDVARDAFIASDEHGCVIEWNKAAERIFGWRRDEVVGLYFSDLIVPPESRDRHSAGMARMRDGGPAKITGKRLAMSALTRQGRVTVELTVGWVMIRKKMVFVASARPL